MACPGNFPQALSHLALIGTAYNPSSSRGPAQVRGRATAAGTRRPPTACSDMTPARPIVDPADCHRRAQQCRERAQRSTTNSTEFLEAAETWEELARHAETLRDAFQKMGEATKPSA
jgi:hypothetical protein